MRIFMNVSLVSPFDVPIVPKLSYLSVFLGCLFGLIPQFAKARSELDLPCVTSKNPFRNNEDRLDFNRSDSFE